MLKQMLWIKFHSNIMLTSLFTEATKRAKKSIERVMGTKSICHEYIMESSSSHAIAIWCKGPNRTMSHFIIWRKSPSIQNGLDQLDVLPYLLCFACSQCQNRHDLIAVILECCYTCHCSLFSKVDSWCWSKYCLAVISRNSDWNYNIFLSSEPELWVIFLICLQTIFMPMEYYYAYVLPRPHVTYSRSFISDSGN